MHVANGPDGLDGPELSTVPEFPIDEETPSQPSNGPLVRHMALIGHQLAMEFDNEPQLRAFAVSVHTTAHLPCPCDE